MAKVKILFLAVCSLAGLSWVNHSSHHLAALKGLEIVQIAESQLGVCELTNSNDGKAVEAYLRYTGFEKGNAWCAAFVSWVYAQAGFKAPKTAWSPALFPKSKITRSTQPGIVYGLYDRNKGRIVHCGIVKSTNSGWVMGIEGNTNAAGSVEGDGVYLKRRHTSSIHTYADWISTRGGGYAN